MRTKEIELIVRIISSAFVAEFIAMMILIPLNIKNPLFEALVDSILISMLITPFLIWWVYRPIKENFEVALGKEKIYRRLIESTGTGYVILSVDGKIVDIDKSFKNMVSIDIDKVSFENKRLPELFKKEMAEKIFSTIAKVLTTKKWATMNIMHDQDGVPSVLRLTFNYVLDQGKEMIFVLCQEEIS